MFVVLVLFCSRTKFHIFYANTILLQQDKLSSDHSTQNADQLNGLANGHQSNGNTSQGSGGQSGKGSKGIRNRVFCGECSGCLKNDDCGKCRYCKDKTKFGGQNRLRQKCLHRRCQVRITSNMGRHKIPQIQRFTPGFQISVTFTKQI